MRADLNKQLCERERVGHSRRYKDVRRSKKLDTPDEDGVTPARESMKRRHVLAADTKSFNENLNPLWGQVRKAVGRPWNAFYSELCQNFDKRSVINQHILQHLLQYVEQNVYIKDGQLMVPRNYGRHQTLKEAEFVEYYVDPRDGILKYNKYYQTYKQRGRERAREAEKEQAAIFRQLDKDNVLHKINDVWYHFTLKDVPEGRYVYEKPPNRDTFPVGGKLLSWDRLHGYQKELHGVRSFVGESAVDVFTGDVLYSDGSSVRIRSHGPRERYGKIPNRYHATKKTASHKTLKQAGLV